MASCLEEEEKRNGDNRLIMSHLIVMGSSPLLFV